MEQILYETDGENKYRYVLGKRGENPLICIGVNPSTATPEKPDQTIKALERRAKQNGYDGWIMVNLYPFRATKPDDLPKRYDPKVLERNKEVIGEIMRLYPAAEIWAAWGALIEKRGYLWECLGEILQVTEKRQWVTFGPHTRKGHPHHPLRLKNDLPKEVWSAEAYYNRRK